MASLLNYLPSNKAPDDLNLNDLNEAVKAIRHDGMLRIHAMGRLLDELDSLAYQKGLVVSVDGSGFTDKYMDKPTH